MHTSVLLVIAMHEPQIIVDLCTEYVAIIMTNKCTIYIICDRTWPDQWCCLVGWELPINYTSLLLDLELAHLGYSTEIDHTHLS